MSGGGQMLSRVADHLYWLSRYLERAEHTARLLEISVTLAPDRTPESASRHGVRILSALQALDAQRAGMVEFSTLAVDLTVGDRDESLLACVSHARENARQVREQISGDMWEELNRLYLRLQAAREDKSWQEQPEDLFREVRHSVYLFKGMKSATMARGEGWQYMELARFLERSINTSMLIDVHLREFHDSLRTAVLTSGNGQVVGGPDGVEQEGRVSNSGERGLQGHEISIRSGGPSVRSRARHSAGRLISARPGHRPAAPVGQRRRGKYRPHSSFGCSRGPSSPPVRTSDGVGSSGGSADDDESRFDAYLD